VQVEKAGRNRQLTERDRELCGFLAVCRYLTREQIERLMFPGRSKARSSTRLRQLARRVGSQRALLRSDLGFGSAEGWTTVWALTDEGFEVGSLHMGLKLERVPKQDVGQAFLKHEVMANEVFLGLVPQGGNTWAKVPRSFRWVLGEYLDLPFEDYATTHGAAGPREAQAAAGRDPGVASVQEAFLDRVRDRKRDGAGREEVHLDDGQARSLRHLLLRSRRQR